VGRGAGSPKKNCIMARTQNASRAKFAKIFIALRLHNAANFVFLVVELPPPPPSELLFESHDVNENCLGARMPNEFSLNIKK
jgi:hypothetical protein